MKLLRKVKSDFALSVDAENAIAYPNYTFHDTFSFIIVFGQIFGIMPLHGISSRDIKDVKFKWKSLKVIYSLCNVIGSLVMGIFCILKFAIYGLQLDKTATMSFYVLNFFGAIQFIQIGRNWTTVLKEWSFVEMSMRSYGSIPHLKKRFVIMTAVVMLLALIEHLLFILTALFASKNCANYQNEGGRVYFTMAFPSVFGLIEFSTWKACLVEFFNVLATVTWNYIDLFIILISCSLAARFSQINIKLRENTVMHEKFWRDIREDYNKVTHLTRVVDRYVAPIVMVSFISNTFFICVQLYNSLKIRVGLLETLYYFFSFGFLLGRTTAVTLYGAWINDESKKPLQILHAIPSEYYCVEIGRLVQQINSSPVAISGSRFFLVTRSFLLKMASTIVTFELMFLQFGPLLKATVPQDEDYNCVP